MFYFHFSFESLIRQNLYVTKEFNAIRSPDQRLQVLISNKQGV